MTTNNHTAISTGAVANARHDQHAAGRSLTLHRQPYNAGHCGHAYHCAAIGTAAMTLKANAVDVAAVLADGIITNDKLATDVKIGSLSTLTTAAKGAT